MNYRQIKEIEQKNKERILTVNRFIKDDSGIYFLTREDANGFRYAYIGQAKHVLTRLAQHLVGYQHIDLSLKKYGLYSQENEYGWKINAIDCPVSLLDEKEQQYIKLYADSGYQLRNKTSGSQGKGKAQIDNFKPHKSYREGVQQGRIALARELKHIVDKHLTIELKAEKKANKTSQKMLEKFLDLLNEENYERTEQ